LKIKEIPAEQNTSIFISSPPYVVVSNKIKKCKAEWPRGLQVVKVP
jgi:hypothetical protein